MSSSSLSINRRNPYRPVPHDEEGTSDEDNQLGEGNISDKEQEIVFFIKKKPNEEGTRSNSTTYRSSICLVILFVIVVILLAISYTVYALSVKAPTTAPTTAPTSNATTSANPTVIATNLSVNWKFEVIGGLSELSLLVHDFNSDGTPDILVNNITTRGLLFSYDVCPGNHKRDKCLETLGFTPCQVRLLALSGKDGSIVWSKWLPFPSFAANCKEDFNKDGHKDCLFAGRSGGFVAYDIYHDNLLWYIDSNVTCPAYNYYYPLIIEDMNNDGVKDIFLTHGGDSFYTDLQKLRSPGFVVVVSGLTGQQLSEHILTPDAKETYSSPIMYTLHDGTDLILFGSGGETATGSLWAISLRSLSDHVTRFNQNVDSYNICNAYISRYCMQKDPKLSDNRPLPQPDLYSRSKTEEWMKDCPQLSHTKKVWNKYQLCVYEFTPTGNKSGTMLPPVVVDINNDQVMDLIVSQFNDHTILYDGASSSISWDYYQPDTQTYSIPAPMYFNDDNVLDLVMRFSKGEWDDYVYSLIEVLDGATGKDLLWSFNCSRAAMSSPVVIRNKRKGHDGFLFIAMGCGQNGIKSKREVTTELSSKGTCSNRRWKFEQKVCKRTTTTTRLSKRHDDDEDDDDDDNDELIIPVADIHEVNISSTDGFVPDDIWEIRNDSDKFPNPLTQTDEFISDYCGLVIDSLVATLYFLTPNLISKQSIIPLITFKPYVHVPPSIPKSFHKRHSSSSSFSDEDDTDDAKKLKLLKQNLHKNRKMTRCSHILSPWYSPSTPAVADLNGDGKLEVIVNMGFSTAVHGAEIPPQLGDIIHPQNVTTIAFTLQDKVEEVYGSEINNEIDFSSYYPITEQPWTQYMGADGTGIYNNPL